MTELTLGFSPCPNDTFIFDAMVHKKVDTEGLDFKVQMADVEELNRMAFQEKLDITKLSFHAFLYLTEHYSLLNSGSALGKGVGPLLLSKKPITDRDLSNLSVAVPGKFTTANLLLSLAYPELESKKIMLFSEIEEAVLNGYVDLGLIIHENRFTYLQKGLVKIEDLGEYWEEKTEQLIPLGGIVCRRNMDPELQQKIDRVIKRSIEYAYDNPDSGMDYILQNSQEMEIEVVKKHIDLYVNKYSIALGEEGRHSVEALFEMAEERGLIKSKTDKIFID